MRNSLGSGLIVVVALAAPLIAASAPAQCVGDCDGSSTVTVNELVLAVAIALDETAPGACPAFTAPITVDQLIRAIDNALGGCPPVASPPRG